MIRIIQITGIKIFLILGCLATYTFGAEQNSLKRVFFENHSSLSNEQLESMVSVYKGIPIDKGNARAIADSIEEKLRAKSQLSYAVVSSCDRKNGVVTIRVGEYRDMDERILGEMKNHPIEKGKINRIFFRGNESITTKELTIRVQGLVGLAETKENIQKIIDKVDSLYATRGHKNIYGRFEYIDSEHGIYTVRICKKK